ncbi:sensor histidine kinase [Alkalihalobacillus sp. BA299]|uniref:ATP-binding protein n=1 Tax=Alkalihalobacillus sp. BA299 TaxID=2815938 RepID=UPI001FFE072D
MKMSPYLWKDYTIIVLMLLFVPLAGEINFYPINEAFRISLGPPAFFFSLLFLRKTPAIIPGFLTAILVVGFRILLDMMYQDFNWLSSFESHYPTFFFYFTYAFIFYLVKVNRFHDQPIVIGVFGIIIEIIADFAEFIAQFFVLGVTITTASLAQIFFIALSHSFIVLGVFSMMKLYEARSREVEVRKRNEHMLLLISNLYEESIHLKKTLQTAEDITRKSFGLYKEMKQSSTDDLEKKIKSSDKVIHQLLQIAGEVHEIKKDNQRIYAGLSELISKQSFTDYININNLMEIIAQTNKKYACLLGKNIDLEYIIQDVHRSYHVYTILSIINNVVANAVEAIQEIGTIKIYISRQQNFLKFHIEDDGPGIPEKYKDIIFNPGFTSKFDNTGNPSTGIGLTYVKDMVGRLNGKVTHNHGPNHKGTIFTITLPIENLVEKELIG